MVLDVERIKKAFPSEWPVIFKRCAIDPEMVEICNDLDQLAADIEMAETGFAYMSDCLKADVLGSIEALAQEIRERISLN